MKAILWALPFQVIGIWIIEAWKHAGLLQTNLDFEVLFAVLSGDYGEHPEHFVRKLYANAGLICFYMAALWGYALILGHGFRHIVWRRKLDVRYSLLRFRNEWLYRLKGREVTPPYIGAEVLVLVEALTRIAVEEAKEKTRLYRGLLWSFSMDDDGMPKEILLKDPQRGEFTLQGRDVKLNWKPITPSSVFILKYDDLLNLNITYALPARAPLVSPVLSAQTEKPRRARR